MELNRSPLGYQSNTLPTVLLLLASLGFWNFYSDVLLILVKSSKSKMSGGASNNKFRHPTNHHMWE